MDASVTNWLEWFEQLRSYVRSLPITVFYVHLWNRNKPLLGKSLVWNYIMPVLLEILLPWWASRRKLLIQIRYTRIRITHSMQTNQPQETGLMRAFLVLTLLHGLIDTVMKVFKDRVAKEHKLAVRKLVMERVLYSELASIETVKGKDNDLVYRITQDLGQTLAFFNFTAPAMIASLYALVLEGNEVWKNRRRLDVLAVAFPPTMYLVRTGLSWLFGLEKAEPRVKAKKKEKKRKQMAQFVSNALDGILDIQINNLQEAQLKYLDSLIEAETGRNKSIARKVSKRVWETVSSRGAFQYVAEVYVIHQIMRRKNIDFSQYRKLQEDIDQLVSAARRIFELVMVSRDTFDYQERVVDLVNMPSWLERDAHLSTTDVGAFREIRVRDIRFSYNPNDSLVPPAVDLHGQDLIFERGKKYAIAGQNTAGKSTLSHILCKMYEPQEGVLTLNGVSYDRIPRMVVRDMISYVSQRPFLFPGTIRDNILIGNPEATEEEAIASPRSWSRASSSSGEGLTASEEGEDSTVRAPAMPRRGRSSGESEFAYRRGSRSSETSPTRGVAHDVEMLKRIQSIPNLASLTGSTRRPMRGHRRSKSSTVEMLIEEGSEYSDKQIQSILNQKVAKHGTNISGGFAQSVALARVFVRPNSRVLILDEAMGQMDGVKKRDIIYPRLFEFVERNHMTLIVITHDLDIFQSVDWIYVLDGGVLVSSGTHHQLMEQNEPAYLDLTGQRDWVP